MSTEIPTRPLRTIRENLHRGPQGVDDSSLERAALRLLSEAGHDLRSPLTGIRSAIQLLAEEHLGPLNASQAELLADTLAQCDSLLDLSENMLSIARIQQSNFGLLCSWVDPNELYRSVRTGLESIARVKNIRIRWDGFASFRFPLFGDKIALQRLIYNLAGNAIQSSPEDSDVCVTLRRGKDPKLAEIVTSDSGPGIHPSVLNKISKRGFSGQNRTGLGLAICQSLATYQLTRLQVQTPPDGGSQFSFEVAYGDISSVARLYAKWRETIYRVGQANDPNHSSLGTFPTNELQSQSITPTVGRNSEVRKMPATTTLRVDAAYTPSNSSRSKPLDTPAMYLPINSDQPNHPNAFVATQLHLPAECESSASGESQLIKDMNRFVQTQQRPHELAYHYADLHWFMFWDCDVHACQVRQKQLVSEFESRFAVLPVFEKPVLVSIDPELRDTKSTVDFIQELMLRSILRERLPHSANHFNSYPRRRRSNPGQASPLEARPSPAFEDLVPDSNLPSTWSRIDQEIRQLRLQLSNQARRLSAHADRLNR